MEIRKLEDEGEAGGQLMSQIDDTHAQKPRIACKYPELFLASGMVLSEFRYMKNLSWV